MRQKPQFRGLKTVFKKMKKKILKLNLTTKEQKRCFLGRRDKLLFCFEKQADHFTMS